LKEIDDVGFGIIWTGLNKRINNRLEKLVDVFLFEPAKGKSSVGHCSVGIVSIFEGTITWGGTGGVREKGELGKRV
jgi:hypothetical protein